MSLQATTQRGAPRWWEGDLVHDFIRSPVALVAAASTLLIVAAAIVAGLIAPYDSNDPASANVIDARLPPGSSGMTADYYLLGTDPQGRDMLSAILFGTRMSLMVGASSVLLAALIGIVLGLVCGYFRGLLDAVIMRIADVQLGFPAILIALLIDGITRTDSPFRFWWSQSRPPSGCNMPARCVALSWSSAARSMCSRPW